MVIAYFGADGSIEGENELSIRRRNMAVLYTLGQSDNVDKIINCIRGTRNTIWKNFRSENTSNKIIDYYFGPILPENGFLVFVNRPLNLLLLSFLNRKVSKLLRDKKTISWCYWPNGFLNWEYLHLQGKIVFDTDHNIVNDPKIEEVHKKERVNLLLRTGNKAEFILSSSRSMLEWYRKQGFHQTRLVLNGVFEKRIGPEKNNVQDNMQPIVTYCGTLSQWIKIEWLLSLIKKRSDWKFNIIGSDYQTELSRQLVKYENVHLHGFLQPSEVSKILQETNVAIGLYKEEESLDVNSMKLYDYLANGVPPVVNKYHEHLQMDFENLLTLASSYEEFEFQVEKQIYLDLDLKKSREFLLRSTWEKRLDPILNDLK